MKTRESESDQFGTFISGLAFTGVLAIILFLFCFAIDESWFDYSLTFILIAIICIGFFISGLKRIGRKQLGFLVKLGKPDFTLAYTQGIYWIFPLWKFEQKPDFNYKVKGEEIKLNLLTKNEIPLDVKVNYCWEIKDLKKIDENSDSMLIKESVEYELSNYIRNKNSIEIFADESNAKKMMIKLFEEVGEGIGILISKVIPLIKYEEKYTAIAGNIEYKYKALERELLYSQKEKRMNLEIERDNMILTFEKLGIPKEDALSYLKVLKNQVNVNENTYNVNVDGLNKVIDSVILFLKSNL
jgi:hypothetical protein